MAEIGNEFPIQNTGLNIPGLSSARISNEEDNQNNRIEEDRRNSNRVEQPQQDQPGPNRATDRVTVVGRAQARSNPGVAEQRALQANGELLIVPSQNVQENLRNEELQSPAQGRSVADLNDVARQLTEEPQGRGPVGGVDALSTPTQPNLGEINQEIRDAAAQTTPSLDQIQQQQGAEILDPQQQQSSAQDRTVQRLVEEVVDDGRGQGLAARAPTNPIFETPSQDLTRITNDRAGLADVSTGRPNAQDGGLRDALRQSTEEQQARANEENRQRRPEPEQNQRGQNIDRLI